MILYIIITDSYTKSRDYKTFIYYNN